VFVGHLFYLSKKKFGHLFSSITPVSSMLNVKGKAKVKGVGERERVKPRPRKFPEAKISLLK